MKALSRALLLVWLAACGDDKGLLLGPNDDGKDVSATVGSLVRVKLRTIGPGSYADPELSTDVVKFEGSEVVKPHLTSGPLQLFRFRCEAEGTCEISIPHTDGVADPEPSFAFTLHCK